MKKIKILLKVSLVGFLFLWSCIVYCDEISEKEDFQALCRLYQDTAGTTASLGQANSFLKRNSKSVYASKVQFIIANSYGDNEEAIKIYEKLVKKERNSELAISALVNIGQIYYNLGKYNEAAEYYQRIINDFPNHFIVRETLYELMQAQIAVNKWDAAEKTLHKLAQIDPYYEKQDKVIFSYGLILFKKNAFEFAYQKFNLLNTAEAQFYQGRCQQKLQKFIPATVTFKQLLTQYPNSDFVEDTRFLIADCYYLAADYPVALDEFNQFLNDFPESYLKENALYRIGCCSYQQKIYTESITKLRAFLQENYKSEFAPFASFMVGESFLAQNDLVRAAFAYGDILKTYPQTEILPQTYYKLGWCYTKQNSYDSAIDMFNRLITGYPKHPLVPFALLLSADNYNKKGSLDQAIDCYRKILDSPERKEDMTEAALFMMTKTFYDARRFNEIISSFQYILNSLPPSNSEWRSYTYLMVAEAYYSMGLFTESTRVYDMIEKNFPYTQVAAMAQEGKAWSAFKVKDYSKAQKERQEFTEDLTVKKGKSTEISNEFEMGNIYFNQKKYTEALGSFEKFVQTYPDDELVPEALYSTGRCYYKLEYYTKAIESWQKLVNTYPKHSRAQEAMNLISDTYFRAQKYPEAIESFKKIITTYPGTDAAKQAQLRIGQCYYNANDDETAILEFEKFINIYPNDSTAETALEGMVTSAYRMSEAGTNTDLDIKAMQNFITRYPKSKLTGNAQYRLALRYYDKKDFANAAEEFNKVSNYFAAGQIVPDSYFYGAESYYSSQKYEDAAPIYRRFIKNFPKHERIRLAYLHLANSLYYTEKYLEAAQVYQDLTRLTKDKDDISQTALLNTALCLKKAEKWQDAATVYERFLDAYPTSENHNNTLIELFSLYEILKQYDNAVAVAEELLDKIPKTDPLRPELMYKIGEIDLKQGNTQTGIEELLDLITYKPADDPWRLTALARVAQEYENQKKWDDANSMYKEIINSATDQKWVTAAKERIDAISQMAQ